MSGGSRSPYSSRRLKMQVVWEKNRNGSADQIGEEGIRSEAQLAAGGADISTGLLPARKAAA